MRLVLFFSSEIFVLKLLMKHAVFLISWLGIYMNLRLVVLILTYHPLASLPMPLLCVKFAIVLITAVLFVPIIFLMKGLPDLVV